MNTETALLHALPHDPLTGAVSVPIYQTSTFEQEAPGQHKGFDYSRTNNPTRGAFERLLAHLEGGTLGIAFSSGLAAVDAVLKLLSTGDHIVAVDDIYGGSTWIPAIPAMCSRPSRRERSWCGSKRPPTRH